MKTMTNRIKFWVIYDQSYNDGDEEIGWTSNEFIAKTYFKHRREIAINRYTTRIVEFDNKRDIKPFILSLFPDIYTEFSDDYGENGLDLFDDLELKKFSYNGRYTISTDAYICKCETYMSEMCAFDYIRQSIERYNISLNKFIPFISDETIKANLVNLTYAISCYMIVIDFRMEHFDQCYYGFSSDEEDYDDFKSKREACLEVTGIDIVSEDMDFDYVGVLNNISVYEYQGMLRWIGSDEDEK